MISDSFIYSIPVPNGTLHFRRWSMDDGSTEARIFANRDALAGRRSRMPSQPSSSSHQLFILTQISQISRKMHCCARIGLRDGYFFNHRLLGFHRFLQVAMLLLGGGAEWHSKPSTMNHQQSTIILTQTAQTYAEHACCTRMGLRDGYFINHRLHRLLCMLSTYLSARMGLLRKSS